MKLFYHLFGYLLVGMVVLISIDEYLNFRTEVEQFERNMVANGVQTGRAISGMITHVWRESGEEQAMELIADADRLGTIGVHWIWLEELAGGESEAALGDERLQALRDGEVVSWKGSVNGEDTFLYTAVPVDVGGMRQGVLEMKQPLSLLKTFRHRMIERALRISVLLAAASGLLLFYFINRNIRVPLSRLVARAKRIGEGDLSADHHISGSDELAEMARTLNDLCSSLTIAKEKIKFEYDARLKTLDQLRHTERLSTFGLIAAGIAHEIGTPLNVVDGRAKMIIHEDIELPEIKECAAIIKTQAERMTVIIRQLLDFTRRPKQQKSEENIVFILRQIFQLLHPLASRQRVSFTLDRAEEAEVLLSADGAQIQQVLINLLMNSVQAMPEGGNVCVSVSNEMLTSAEVTDQQARLHMKIRIVDQGVGICQEDVEHIFTPFYTTKTVGTGTGLGLSIAHGIVEEHGGWIEVESSVRNGACFSVYLPMRERG